MPPIPNKSSATAMDISIILPVLNESDNLRVLIPRLGALMRRERLDFEILVIEIGRAHV